MRQYKEQLADRQEFYLLIAKIINAKQYADMIGGILLETRLLTFKVINFETG